MEPLGDDELISIFEKLDNKNDRKSFYRVSKQFLKVACIRLNYLHISFPDVLKDILLPNMVRFRCSKPLSNTYMELLARSSPNLRNLYLESAQDIDPQKADYEEGEYEYDFDDNGLCKVANACKRLSQVWLSRRLHVGDVGLYSLIRSCKNLSILYLDNCVGVTDESLKAIGESNSLKYVNLKGCLVTDLGLEYLTVGNLKNSLRDLDLSECDRISDAGIFYLKELCCLTYVNLSKCGVNVTDTGVVALVRRNPNFKILDLSWLSSITNISLCEIASKCLKLKSMSLSGCEAISGEGLCVFAHHPTLRYLDLDSCHGISLEDVKLVVVTLTGMRRISLSKSMKAQMTEDNRTMGHRCRVMWL
ncbi:leucine-rich repeat, cysteine-containing subtype protein [Tanacetum coccineum]